MCAVTTAVEHVLRSGPRSCTRVVQQALYYPKRTVALKDGHRSGVRAEGGNVLYVLRVQIARTTSYDGNHCEDFLRPFVRQYQGRRRRRC